MSVSSIDKLLLKRILTQKKQTLRTQAFEEVSPPVSIMYTIVSGYYSHVINGPKKKRHLKQLWNSFQTQCWVTGHVKKAYILLQHPPNRLSSPLNVQQVVKISKPTPKCKNSTLPTVSLLMKLEAWVKVEVLNLQLLCVTPRPGLNFNRWVVTLAQSANTFPGNWRSQVMGCHVTGDARFKLGTQVSHFRPGGHTFQKALGQAARCFN